MKDSCIAGGWMYLSEQMEEPKVLGWWPVSKGRLLGGMVQQLDHEEHSPPPPPRPPSAFLFFLPLPFPGDS